MNQELDRWIAENVMGWVVCYTAETWTDKSEAWWCDKERHEKGETRIGGPNSMGICHEGSFNPTESISDAFQVVDKLIADGKVGYFEVCVSSSGKPWAVFVGYEGQGYHVEAEADDRSLAICLAAKKAWESKH